MEQTCYLLWSVRIVFSRQSSFSFNFDPNKKDHERFTLIRNSTHASIPNICGANLFACRFRFYIQSINISGKKRHTALRKAYSATYRLSVFTTRFYSKNLVRVNAWMTRRRLSPWRSSTTWSITDSQLALRAAMWSTWTKRINWTANACLIFRPASLPGQSRSLLSDYPPLALLFSYHSRTPHHSTMRTSTFFALLTLLSSTVPLISALPTPLSGTVLDVSSNYTYLPDQLTNIYTDSHWGRTRWSLDPSQASNWKRRECPWPGCTHSRGYTRWHWRG